MSDHELDDDGKLGLPSDTLAALQEFYTDKESREKRFEDLKLDVERKGTRTPLSMDMFSEDWNASQFWYSDETATLLAKQLLEGASVTTRICVVSAPSVFVQLKNLLASGIYGNPHIRLLEFDNRFDVFQEFVRYDFEHPLTLPNDMKGKYDHILCDPPFLSPDCQTKAAMTIRWLSNITSPGPEGLNTRVIGCGRRHSIPNMLKTGSAMTSDAMLISNVVAGHGDNDGGFLIFG